jgi:hypothetical protein
MDDASSSQTQAKGNGMTIDWQRARETYRRDGVVFLPQVLDRVALRQALEAYEWSLANPGAGSSKFKQTTDATFYQDLYNLRVLEGYRAMLESSPIPKICTKLWGSRSVWFMYEQVFLKEGGETRRTPWHQDGSYLPIDGDDVAVAWITFDALSKEDSLEFVAGSHKGVVYNGSRFELGDDTAPLDERSPLPRLPNIQAEREKWRIVSWPIVPGDLIVFHLRTLHGGAPTHPGSRRRTLTLRFFGERAHYDPKIAKALPNVPDLPKKLKPGDLFRDPTFLQLC